MEEKRNRQWRIDKKKHWIRKRLKSILINTYRIVYEDSNYIIRKNHLWFFQLGSQYHREFKSNSWKKIEGSRYGKKRFKGVYARESYYSKKNNKNIDKKLTLELMKDAEIT